MSLRVYQSDCLFFYWYLGLVILFYLFIVYLLLSLFTLFFYWYLSNFLYIFLSFIYFLLYNAVSYLLILFSFPPVTLIFLSFYSYHRIFIHFIYIFLWIITFPSFCVALSFFPLLARLQCSQSLIHNFPWHLPFISVTCVCLVVPFMTHLYLASYAIFPVFSFAFSFIYLCSSINNTFLNLIYLSIVSCYIFRCIVISPSFSLAFVSIIAIFLHSFLFLHYLPPSIHCHLYLSVSSSHLFIL